MPNMGRFGKLLVFIGFLIFLIFLITDQLGQPDYRYLCSGLIILALGVLLFKKNRTTKVQNQRFRIFRKKRKDKEINPEANNE
jgi:hypothetical protein